MILYYTMAYSISLALEALPRGQQRLQLLKAARVGLDADGLELARAVEACGMGVGVVAVVGAAGHKLVVVGADAVGSLLGRELEGLAALEVHVGLGEHVQLGLAAAQALALQRAQEGRSLQLAALLLRVLRAHPLLQRQSQSRVVLAALRERTAMVLRLPLLPPVLGCVFVVIGLQPLLRPSLC